MHTLEPAKELLMKLKALISLSVVCTICLTTTFAQTTHSSKFKVGKHLLIWFPRVPDSLIMAENSLKMVETEGLTYLTSVNNSDSTTINGKKDFEKALKDVTSGYLSGDQSKRFKNKAIDTSIGGSKGKYLHLFDGPADMGTVEIFAFLTIQDRQLYTIQVVAPDGLPVTRDSVAAFFQTAEFHGKNYPDKSNAYQVGYILGRYIFPVVLIGLLIIFIVWRINKNNRNDRNRKLTGSI